MLSDTAEANVVASLFSVSVQDNCLAPNMNFLDIHYLSDFSIMSQEVFKQLKRWK